MEQSDSQCAGSGLTLGGVRQLCRGTDAKQLCASEGGSPAMAEPAHLLLGAGDHLDGCYENTNPLLPPSLLPG